MTSVVNLKSEIRCYLLKASEVGGRYAQFLKLSCVQPMVFQNILSSGSAHIYTQAKQLSL